MPSNLSADERAAVERVKLWLDVVQGLAPMGDSAGVRVADLRTLLAVVARAGEASAVTPEQVRQALVLADTDPRPGQTFREQLADALNTVRAALDHAMTAREGM